MAQAKIRISMKCAGVVYVIDHRGNPITETNVSESVRPYTQIWINWQSKNRWFSSSTESHPKAQVPSILKFRLRRSAPRGSALLMHFHPKRRHWSFQNWFQSKAFVPVVVILHCYSFFTLYLPSLNLVQTILSRMPVLEIGVFRIFVTLGSS